MKIRSITLITLATLILTGCNKKNTQNEDKPQGEDLTPDFVIDAQLCDTMETLEDKSVYNIKLNYTDKYFKYDASKFRKDLMLLSFGATNSAVEKPIASKFFADIGFTTLYTSPEYETIGSEDSAQYFIVKKKIDDFTVFAVTFKGHRYGREWANNLTLGESGDHVGFMTTATKVYENLLTFISSENNYKLWFSGYSRGGALANVLSYLVMNNANLGINESNLYTYTFAGTRALTKGHAKAYKNVFNMFNSADILSNFAPEKYGLYRCGTDIDIFDENLDEYLSSFSSELELGDFKSSRGLYSNDAEYTQFFLSQLLTESEDEEYPYDLCTREHYFEVQDKAKYLVSHVLGMPGYLPIISEKFANLPYSELIKYITDDGEKLYETAKEIFDENNVDYEDEPLLESCKVVISLLKRYSGLIMRAVTESKNASRMISMHYTETIYILINRL